MRSRRLAIVGGGSSGLVTLKHALDALPDWEIVCFEKSATTTGCWGDPYPGFVSTST
jgi:cation diffusion facilitator CzcD-associated flavoprotein CzcO